MGAINFETIGRGATVREAYSLAVSDAIGEYGRNPYNGTISTTRGFVEIKDSVASVLARVKAQAKKETPSADPFNYWNYNIERLEKAVASKDGREQALAIANGLIALDDPRLEKWGPAGAIKITDGEWLFFGWAAE